MVGEKLTFLCHTLTHGTDLRRTPQQWELRLMQCFLVCVHLFWYEITISASCLSVCHPPGWAATKDKLCQDAAGEQGAAQGDRAAQEGATAVQEVQGEATDQQEVIPGHVDYYQFIPSHRKKIFHNLINHV